MGWAWRPAGWWFAGPFPTGRPASWADRLSPGGPGVRRFVARDLVRGERLLPAGVRRALGVGGFLAQVLGPLGRVLELGQVDGRRTHDARAGAAVVALSRLIESALNATPLRPSTVHGVATSLATATICRFVTFGSPAVVTLMTSAPVSSIATSSVV